MIEFRIFTCVRSQKILLSWNRKLTFHTHILKTTKCNWTEWVLVESFFVSFFVEKECIESIWTRNIASNFVPFTWIMISIADTLDIGLSCRAIEMKIRSLLLCSKRSCDCRWTAKKGENKWWSDHKMTSVWIKCTHTHIATADFSSSFSGMLLLLRFLFLFLFFCFDRSNEGNARK